jgi:hypothetical protein
MNYEVSHSLRDAVKRSHPMSCFLCSLRITGESMMTVAGTFRRQTLLRLALGGQRAKPIVFGAALFASLLVSRPVFAQTPPAEQLKIVVADETKQYRQGDKKPIPIKVQVLNEVDIPQPAAEVTFLAPPADGPAVTFDTEITADQNCAVPVNEPDKICVKSNDEGFVTLARVIGNDIKGPVTVSVSASFEGKSGTQTVIRTIQGRFWTKNRKIVAAGAAAATAALLYEFLKPGPPTGNVTGATATVAPPH